MPTAPLMSNTKAKTATRGLQRRCGCGPCSITAGKPPRASRGSGFSSTPGSRRCVLCSNMRQRRPRASISLSAEFDEIAVAKPLAVVENRDDLGVYPKQHDIFQLCRRVACDLREPLEHQLARLVHLLRVGDPLCSAADREPTNVVPACVR